MKSLANAKTLPSLLQMQKLGPVSRKCKDLAKSLDQVSCKYTWCWSESQTRCATVLLMEFQLLSCHRLLEPSASRTAKQPRKRDKPTPIDSQRSLSTKAGVWHLDDGRYSKVVPIMKPYGGFDLAAGNWDCSRQSSKCPMNHPRRGVAWNGHSCWQDSGRKGCQWHVVTSHAG